MNLKIISRQAVKEHEVVWIEIFTPSGNFVIQTGYAPTTFLLIAGKEFIYRYRTGKQESILLELGGILKIDKKKASLLVN